MRPYIVNLTDSIIGNYRFDALRSHFLNRERFLHHIKLSIETGVIRDMNPATLGKIMCSFESGDVMADCDDLSRTIRFGGDCDLMLREIVATCLAYAIYQRLSSEQMPGVPPYRSRVVDPDLETDEDRRLAHQVGQMR